MTYQPAKPLWALLLVTLTGSVAQGSVEKKTTSRTVPSFTGVEVASGIHASVLFGAEQRVALTGKEESLKQVSTEVMDGHLLIKRMAKLMRGDSAEVIEVQITLPKLTYIGASGRAEVRVGELAGERCEIKLSGGGTAVVDGQVRTLRLDASGGAKAHLAHTAAASVDVQMSGGSKGEVQAAKEVSGSVSGLAQLVVFRSPESRHVTTSSGGKVRYEAAKVR